MKWEHTESPLTRSRFAKRESTCMSVEFLGFLYTNTRRPWWISRLNTVKLFAPNTFLLFLSIGFSALCFWMKLLVFFYLVYFIANCYCHSSFERIITFVAVIVIYCLALFSRSLSAFLTSNVVFFFFRYFFLITHSQIKLNFRSFVRSLVLSKCTQTHKYVYMHKWCFDYSDGIDSCNSFWPTISHAFFIPLSCFSFSIFCVFTAAQCRWDYSARF